MIRGLVVVLLASLAIATTTGSLAVGIAGSTIAALSEGLPDPIALESIHFDQPTILYDRTGGVELARFEREQRRVVTFDDVPKIVLDATTTAEDRTFWTNSGFDAPAIVAAVLDDLGGDDRGASTITQQLVRARLLPDELTAPGADRYARKVKEIIQSFRLTDAFPGEAGKERLITAYLNEIFYGHGAYGIAEAARIYFGVEDMEELTLAQAALLAGLPKSPSFMDPYRYAIKDAQGRLVVPADSPPVQRRDWILNGLADGARWTKLAPSDLKIALQEPVILVGDQPRIFKAPHLSWQVHDQLVSILGSEAAVETGGYTVITTVDWKAQRTAERWLTAAAIIPNLNRRRGEQMLRQLHIPKSDRAWIRALRGKDLHNGALVALDYTTGDVLAYVGSAGYGRDAMTSPKFSPKFDAAGTGSRQPGSAFKPILYASAFDDRRLTPASLLLDVTTAFDRRQDWAPRDADQLERGPVLVRSALQYSLNIPAVRALERVGNRNVATTAESLGVHFSGGSEAFIQAGLAGALGTVEVRPLDLTSAYGALANGGLAIPPRMILEIRDHGGNVVWRAPQPVGKQAVSPQAAFQVTDILAGNTIRKQNPIWAKVLAIHNGKGGSRRPAAVKTGTSNDARDLATYGFLAPGKGERPALAVGIWMGNSDHSYPRSRRPATSLTAAAPLWHAFVDDYTASWPVTNFDRPKGLVRRKVDAWSGGKPGPWTVETTSAWFIKGTQPGAKHAIDPAGLLYREACGGYRVDLVGAEMGPRAWDRDVADWMRRARRGAGVSGRFDSRTAYFWGESSWGGSLFGSCPPPPRVKKGPGADERPPHGGKPPGEPEPPTPSPPPDPGPPAPP